MMNGDPSSPMSCLPMEPGERFTRKPAGNSTSDEGEKVHGVWYLPPEERIGPDAVVDADNSF
jgi:hypothetical protein